jgi:hypothetical protein
VDEDGSAGVKPNIPPLPVVQPYEPVPYDVTNLTEPFAAAKMGPWQTRRPAAVSGRTSIGRKSHWSSILSSHSSTLA